MIATRWMGMFGLISTLGLTAPALAQAHEGAPCPAPVVQQGYNYDARAAEAAATEAGFYEQARVARFWRERELERRRRFWARYYRRHHRFVPYYTPSYGRSRW